VRGVRQTYRGVVTIECDTDALAEFVHHSGATVDQLDGGRSRVTLLSDSFEWLIGLVAILSQHGDLTVDDPPELRTAVAQTVSRLRDSSSN
jgi:hypothetical protein